MPSLRASAIGLVASGLLAFGSALLPGCGDSDAQNKDYGQPPDPSVFNPGPAGGNGYGSGQGPGKVECPKELKRCAHTFTYPAGSEQSVELRGDWGGPDTWVTGRPMTKAGNVWKVDVPIPLATAVQYKFVINGTDWVIDEAQPKITDANNNTNNTFAGKTCEPALCEEEGALPPGVFDWRDAVLYFVFVDRFFNGSSSNDCTVSGVTGGTSSIANYQGGDWAGVTAKIEDGYFTSLGVNALWITVPFDNPNTAGRGVGGDSNFYSAYHGYWPRIDNDNPATLAAEGCFGTMNELRALIAAAHGKGIKVLIDYAMVHVHSSSSIFTQHPDWFWELRFNDGNREGDCICDDNGVCPWGSQGHRCWFTDYLPHWNYTNPAARQFSVSNAVEWVKQTVDSSGVGIDGFRADAIKHVDQSWLSELRTRIKTEITANQTPQQRFYMVGETYDFGNRDLLKQYVDPATKLDGQFDFPLRKSIVESVLMRTAGMNELASFMDGNDYYYGASALMSTFVGNHDLPRVIHLADGDTGWPQNQYSDGKDRAWSNQPGEVNDAAAFERLANGFAVLFTNRGVPLVYYGDEIGLAGAGDPDNRRFMKWSGFTQNQTALRDRIAKLADIRHKHPALWRGTRTTFQVDADTWGFVRATTGDTVYVAINRSDSPKDVNGLPTTALEELVVGGDVNGPKVTVPPRQTRIFVGK